MRKIAKECEKRLNQIYMAKSASNFRLCVEFGSFSPLWAMEKPDIGAKPAKPAFIHTQAKI